MVLIGGGFLSCEVAAAIATHFPSMQLAMVMPGEDVMGTAGFSKEICHFYEKQLARVSWSSLLNVCARFTVEEGHEFGSTLPYSS